MKETAYSPYLAAFDRKLVEVTPETAQAAIEAANELRASGTIEGVNICGFQGKSLDVLAKLAPMKRIRLQRCASVDLAPLYGQKNLEALTVTPDPLPVDLIHFKNLRAFSGFWHPKTTGLSSLSKLEQIALWKLGPAFTDIASLELPSRLRELCISQAKVVSLRGIESFSDLKSLKLSFLRGAVDFSAVSALKKLRSIELESIPRHVGIERLGRCSSLTDIQFEKCGPIDSLSWVRGLKKLDSLVITETKVVDGDFSMVPKLPKLTVFSADYRREYKPSIKELEAVIDARAES